MQNHDHFGIFTGIEKFSACLDVSELTFKLPIKQIGYREIVQNKSVKKIEFSLFISSTYLIKSQRNV